MREVNNIVNIGVNINIYPSFSKAQYKIID